KADLSGSGDDANADAYPGAPEVCDAAGVDEDCDPTTFGDRDGDGDGFVDARCCNGETCGRDCDDRRDDVKPGQVEICDEDDNDCDGEIDEMAAEAPWYPDCDGDAYGAAGATPVMSCRRPSELPETCGELAPLARWSLNDDDCDDAVSTVRPNAPQICDVYGDNQCGTPNPHDVDGDGYDRLACGGNDCDDTDPSRSPAVERDPCDGVDADCDLFGEDEDGDGFYAIGATCEGDVERTDCDDFRADVGPGFEEVCDGVDNDCDGEVDEPSEADAWCQARVPVGEALCDAGACRITECPALTDDCNGVVEDGCEAPLQIDPDHCGACGNVCSFTCDSRACERPLGVTLGTGHACVIVGAPSASAGDEGSIYCFGFNTEGQLGIGSFGGTYTRPTPVSRPRGVVFHHVRTARRHTCAIDQHDEVWCWGANDSGQLGSEGGNEPAPVPVQGPGGVGVLDQVLTLDAGGFYACAIRPDGEGDGDPTDGTVWCWGRNDGNLGDGTRTDRVAPVQVLREGGSDPLRDIVAISTGRRHACAIDTARELWCWGANADGQLGRGASPGDPRLAYPVRDPSGAARLGSVERVRAGESTTCAITTGGQLYCWGLNDECQLLDAPSPGEPCSGASSALPRALPIADAVDVALGSNHVCVHRSTDATLWCWGGGEFGTERLGRGSGSFDRTIPAPVASGFDTHAPVAMAVRTNSGCAIRADDVVLCWGDNLNGQLGTGDRIDRVEPAQIARPLF
ncbi:MAG TPA: MopE-related protein, partial [Polyangiaceae bacterium LLY-WYZ-15_(1-7)]|nr:MopE-related protein [Polyangiaceae bacterium LLY-WYZ-15_(1-7)]